MSRLFLAAIFLFLISTSVACADSLQSVPYGVGIWTEMGHGNHRALVRVSSQSDAVKVRIPWRRRDAEPEKKDIRVYDASTGKQITNVVRININREYGDLVFQPQTVPGVYEIYYLPYNQGINNFDDAGKYFLPQDTADTGWIQKNSVTDNWKDLPVAEVVEIQARNEFNRFDPMEVIATSEETTALINAHTDKTYMLFPEDRKFPAKMFDDLPFKWVKQGPGSVFSGEAQPGEFYVFQIGVYASKQSISDIKLTFSNLKGKSGSISSKSIRCFNLGGVDDRAVPFKSKFEVGKGQVRPLWIGVQVPKNATGLYQGTVIVKPENAKATSIAINLNIAGGVVKNNGTDDLWRFSRLNWLDSTLGIDEDVVPPYTPLKVSGSTTECLNRAVRFGTMGLPESIVSKGNQILAAPIQISAITPQGTIVWKPGNNKITKTSPATVVRQASAKGGAFKISTNSKMEFDGSITYDIALKANKAVSLEDLRLQIPVKREIATYMMGMGKRGGYRIGSWNWKWSIDHADNALWIGDVDAGLQIKLLLPGDAWASTDLYEAGLPDSWANSGKGGAKISESGDQVLLDVFTGDREFKAGQEIHFNFRLTVTPFKPIDNRHWNWRVATANNDYGFEYGGSNIWQIWHAQPESEFINYPFLHIDKLASRVKQQKSLGRGINLYYTMREISNYMQELWPLRSLGSEIFSTGKAMIYSDKGAVINTAGGGYPWLMEHLVSGYVPAWRQPLESGESDASIATKGRSRLLNYYIESVDWLMKSVGIDGIYLDGLAFDRDIMMRLAKVMYRNDPNYRINFHAGNDYDYLDHRVSPLNYHMGHLAFMSNMWIGEMFDYSRSSDYWLVEISGIPFGISSELLNHVDGGNQWRGMLYGMSGRENISCTAMYKFWDEWGIQDSEMIGYWSPKCPVKTDNPDVLATVYKKNGKALISVSEWSEAFSDDVNKLRSNAVTRIINKAPVIDGKFDANEWDDAAKLGGFVLASSPQLALSQTETMIASDTQNLYIAFRCNGSGDQLKSTATARDGHVWEDDAVEIFIQPDPDSTTFYQFIGNSAGIFYDGMKSSSAWNGDWTYKTTVGQGYWQGEISIPLASMQMKPLVDGKIIGFNVVRDQQSGKSESSSWSRVAESFLDPNRFGRIEFSTTKQQSVSGASVAQKRKSFRLNIDWNALGINPNQARLIAPAILRFQEAAEFSHSDEIPIETSKGWLFMLQD